MPKRRANGEGNIRKRKDGRWEGRYTVGHDPETGKAIIKNVLGKTQAAVKEKLKKAIEENVGIDYGRAKTYTVGTWLEVWMENYAKVKLRPSTFKTSQGFLKNHIKPQIGGIPLADLTSLDLQRFCKHLLDGGRVDRIEAKKKPKGLAPKTVRNIHQMIGSAYNLAMPRIARRILACFSFRSAAAAEPVQQSLQKNLNPHRGSGQADIDEGQIESGNKNGGYFFAQRVQSFCREPAMKWVTGAARARFLAAFARSKAVPPEAGASMISVIPSRPWPSRTAWT